MTDVPVVKATPAQQRALMRLPRSAREIAKDTRRRMLWVRIVRLGLAEWTPGSLFSGDTLVRTKAGDLAIARLTSMVDRAYERFMKGRRSTGARA